MHKKEKRRGESENCETGNFNEVSCVRDTPDLKNTNKDDDGILALFSKNRRTIATFPS